MTVMEKNQLLGFLGHKPQKAWLEALDAIGEDVHPVDREATRIWFSFWPLELSEALCAAEGAEEMARIMDLEGEWKLEEQMDASVAFLYGARHWKAVKNAILGKAVKNAILTQSESDTLEASIRGVAMRVSETDKVAVGLVLGISAVGLMVFRQVGQDVFEKMADSPAAGELLPNNPDRVVTKRKRESRDGVLGFLKGVNRRFEVRWNERGGDGSFHAINGQDIAMAGARADGDYRTLDYRRIDGPVPVECRVGSCGYCWIGLLEGRENLSAISDFERERLRYFGYDTTNDPEDEQPTIRLACQAQSQGDVTLALAPWNGELKRRHHLGRKKLGTA